MFQIMTGGLVFSRHEIRAEAESAIATAKAESLTEIERLLDEIQASKDFAASLTIETI